MNKLFILLIGLLLISCGKDEVVSDIDAEITVWLETAGITATRDDSGIYLYPETSNVSGAAVTTGNVVAIYYNLFDLEDNLLASYQRANGDSLIFKHGVSAAYPVGLDVGVGYMRVGEMFSFVLPPSQAYASLTSGAIPNNRILRLQVELVGVFDESTLFAQELVDIDDYITSNDLNNTLLNPIDPVQQFASGVSYKRLSIGTGTLPINGDTVIVDYSGSFLNGSGNFDSKNGFQWIVGSNNPRELLTGFEFGASLMQTNEDALLLLPSSQAYRESALVIPGSIAEDLISDEIIPDYVSKVPPYSTLIFNITRVD